MIRNDRQVSLAKTKLSRVRAAASDASAADAQVWTALAADLEAEIEGYEGIRDGHHTQFAVSSIDDLADAVVKARIAKGWTQRQLADELGVTEQMVQRDEAGGYERAGLARLAEVCDTLAFQLSGTLQPVAEAYRPVASGWNNLGAGALAQMVMSVEFVDSVVSSPRDTAMALSLDSSSFFSVQNGYNFEPNVIRTSGPSPDDDNETTNEPAGTSSSAVAA
jgi:transcriptional regulator with XRE-family HTH domain